MTAFSRPDRWKVTPWTPPWPSFAEFFSSAYIIAPWPTVHSLRITMMSEHLSQLHLRPVWQAGRERAATFFHHRLGLTGGDRIATVLFNHDQTVVLYFAAWTLGLAVVPINVEEP